MHRLCSRPSGIACQGRCQKSQLGSSWVLILHTRDTLQGGTCCKVCIRARVYLSPQQRPRRSALCNETSECFPHYRCQRTLRDIMAYSADKYQQPERGATRSRKHISPAHRLSEYSSTDYHLSTGKRICVRREAVP